MVRMSRGERLLRSTQRRGIGSGPREQTRHRRQRHIKQPSTDQGHDSPQNHQQDGVGIQQTSLPPQRGEKARPHLHAQSEDKEHESKLL